MPIMSFSIPNHIPKLLDGRKQQTTRKKRKIPLKVGDILYCYYKPRIKAGCKNCIIQECSILDNYKPEVRTKCINCISLNCELQISCDRWTNYFGKAQITSITPFPVDDSNAFNSWAIADGFNTPDEAKEWLLMAHGGNPYLDLEVIHFKPEWL